MKLRNTRGFTLVEIMIVVAIIGILIAIAIPGFIRARNTSRGRAIQNDLVKISNALDQYALDFDRDTEDAGSLPADIAELVTLGYFRVEPEPAISGTTYELPTTWADYPYWDGTAPTDYEELYRHPDAVDAVGTAP